MERVQHIGQQQIHLLSFVLNVEWLVLRLESSLDIKAGDVEIGRDDAGGSRNKFLYVQQQTKVVKNLELIIGCLAFLVINTISLFALFNYENTLQILVYVSHKLQYES